MGEKKPMILIAKFLFLYYNLFRFFGGEDK